MDKEQTANYIWKFNFKKLQEVGFNSIKDLQQLPHNNDQQ